MPQEKLLYIERTFLHVKAQHLENNVWWQPKVPDTFIRSMTPFSLGHRGQNGKLHVKLMQLKGAIRGQL